MAQRITGEKLRTQLGSVDWKDRLKYQTKESPRRWSNIEVRKCYREESRGGEPWSDVPDIRSGVLFFRCGDGKAGGANADAMLKDNQVEESRQT